MKTILKNNQGIAMVVVIAIMVILLSITGAALLFSGLNLKTVSNLTGGTTGVQVADAGIQHAVTLIPVGTTFSYSTLTTLLSNFSFGSGYTYTVTVLNDAASPGGNTRAILTSTASGPNSSSRTVKAYVGRSTVSWAPPGAFYFKGTTTNTNTGWDHYIGSDFRAIGNDTNPDGTAGPKPAVPAIAFDNNGLRDLVKGQVAAGQYPQVAGSGGSPAMATTSTSVNLSTLITNILTLGGASVVERSTGTYDGSGGVTFGTAAAPKITHVTGYGPLNLLGNFSGYGVLIFDGDETDGGSHLGIAENAQFQGLIISTMHVHMEQDYGYVTTNHGTAKVYGAIMMKQNSGQSSFGMDDENKLYYSSKALLDYVQNYWGSAFIQPAKIIGWAETN